MTTPADAHTSRRNADGWVIARISGAPVVIAPTSVVLAALVAGSWLPFVNSLVGDEGLGAVAVTLLLTVVGAALSILLHELAHGLTGSAFGRKPVRYELYLWGGRTTFGPSASWTPWKDVLTSLSGPATNAILWLLCGYANVLLLALPGSVRVALVALAWFNMVLAIFNALPGLPLDGGHALAALVTGLSRNEKLGQKVAACGGLLVAAWAVWHWVLEPFIRYRSRPDGLSLIFVILVLWPLVTTSWQVLGLGRGARAAASLDLRSLAHPLAVLQANESLATVRSHLQAGAALILVVDGPTLLGTIDAVSLVELGAVDEEAVRAREVCMVLPAKAVTTALTGPAAAQALKDARTVSRWLVVVDGGRMSGAVPTGAR